MVARPKLDGGLGVLDLQTHNEAQLSKNFNKFFNKANIPCVQLVWEKNYSNSRLPNYTRQVSFGGGICSRFYTSSKVWLLSLLRMVPLVPFGKMAGMGNLSNWHSVNSSPLPKT